MPTIDSPTIRLTILTPDKKFFEGSVRKVTLPGSAGLFQVLRDHAPLVSTLRQGTIFYEDEQQEHLLAVEGGLVEVSNNSITVLIASADLPGECLLKKLRK
jgi:F-type H+-transporting ATPase subunit epsilon